MPSPEASRLNLEKARSHWRPPKPWRSVQETRLIRLAVWGWYSREQRGSLRKLARQLGISHTYAEHLIREFETNPKDVLAQERLFGRPTEARLRHAQDRTEQMRSAGLLRSYAPS